jgi:hypothetical protein
MNDMLAITCTVIVGLMAAVAVASNWRTDR